MKTAVSIPDELFDRADRLAKKLGITRSALYGAALAEFLARRDPVVVTEAWDQVCEAVGDSGDDFAQAAAAAVLSETEW